MVDIMTALATATQAMKLAQDLRGIDKAIDAADYKLKIADLTSALSDIKMAQNIAQTNLAPIDLGVAVPSHKNGSYVFRRGIAASVWRVACHFPLRTDLIRHT